MCRLNMGYAIDYPKVIYYVNTDWVIDCMVFNAVFNSI